MFILYKKENFMNYKAKKVLVVYGKYSNTVTYEYRGYKYDVEYSTSMNYSCISPKLQHQTEQSKIDAMIAENENPVLNLPAEIGMNLFFDLVEGTITGDEFETKSIKYENELHRIYEEYLQKGYTKKDACLEAQEKIKTFRI